VGSDQQATRREYPYLFQHFRRPTFRQTVQESARVQAAATFAPLVDAERHQRLLDKLDERAGTQRGKPRSQDPSRNPLGGLVFDMGCGWPMYRQPYRDSFRYLCGLYQQSSGAKCKHNHVDGLTATRFLLSCVRQRLLAPKLKARLEQKLRAIAEREQRCSRPDADLRAKQGALATVRAKRERAGENLALAEGPEQFRAVAAVFEQLKQQEKALEGEVRQLEQVVGQVSDVDSEVSAALAGLDRMTDLAASPCDLGGVGQLFRELKARMFLRFMEARWKKRVVNKVAGSVVTFGATPPPVALYEGPTGRRHVKGPTAPEGAVVPCSPESPGGPGNVPGGEGDSLGNVRRGDWTPLELILRGVRLLQSTPMIAKAMRDFDFDDADQNRFQFYRGGEQSLGGSRTESIFEPANEKRPSIRHQGHHPQ
jgi:hypothetical protein